MFAGLLLLLSGSHLYGQATQPSDFEKCLGYPTLADEIRQEIGESQEKTTAEYDDGVRISSIRFDGAFHASAKQKRAIAAELMKHQADPKLQEFTERARDAWQRLGYFKALVQEPKVVYVRENPDEVSMSATIHVDEGPRYTFKTVEWRHGSVFSPDELTPLIPLRRGDIFNTERVREGLNALRQAYGEKGYINFTAVPDTILDDSSHEVTLVLDLDEGKQFRVGSVKVIGSPNADEQKIVDEARASIGLPYTPTLWERALQDTHLRHFRPERDAETKENNQDSTVDIFLTFDHSPPFECPAPDAD